MTRDKFFPIMWESWDEWDNVLEFNNVEFTEKFGPYGPGCIVAKIAFDLEKGTWGTCNSEGKLLETGLCKVISTDIVSRLKGESPQNKANAID